MKRKLLIDTGHSEKFQGASKYKREVDWVRAIAEKLYPKINTLYWGLIKVPDSYPGETNKTTLYKRIQWINANSSKDDLLISIHANAADEPLPGKPEPRGVETCYLSGDDYSKAEALRLTNAFALATGMPLFNDGIMGDQQSHLGSLGIIRDTEPFSLLIETGFVSSKLDMEISIGNAAKGIANYINSLASMPEPSPAPINNFTPEQIDALKFDVDNKFTKIVEPKILLEAGNRIDSIVARYRYHKKLKENLASLGIYLTF